MTPKRTFEHRGTTFTLDQQCSSIRVLTALESEIRRAQSDHHAVTLFNLEAGLYSQAGVEVSEEFYLDMIREGKEKVFGFPDIEPSLVAKFRRTLRGLAAVLQYGCVELRQSEEAGDGSAFKVALQMVSEMDELEREKLHLSIKIAGGMQLAKNSNGPELKTTTVKGHHQTVKDAYESLQERDTVGSK